MTLPPQFLLYIPGRKLYSTDPFNSLILIKATLSPGGSYALAPDPSGSLTTIQLPTAPPIEPPSIAATLLLPDNISTTIRWFRTLTPYAKATKGATQLQIYSIPHFKEIFPGKILRRNLPLTGHGFSNDQLANFSLPLSIGPYHLATSVPSLGAPTVPGAATAGPRLIKKVSPSSMNPYIASQLLAFAQMKGEVCPITAGYYEDKDTAVMPCGHLFSKLAIVETFKTEPHKCPACRAPGAPVFV
jgi:hypothetical protein